MAPKINPVPPGFHTVTPYLIVEGASKLIDFLKQAFDAKVIVCHQQAELNIIKHAQLLIGDSFILLADAVEQTKAQPCSLYLYLADVDAAYKRALQAGATSLMEPADMYYGDRNGGVKDFAGNRWWIGARVEDVSEEEIERRAKSLAAV